LKNMNIIFNDWEYGYDDNYLDSEILAYQRLLGFDDDHGATDYWFRNSLTRDLPDYNHNVIISLFVNKKNEKYHEYDINFFGGKDFMFSKLSKYFIKKFPRTTDLELVKKEIDEFLLRYDRLMFLT